MGELDFSQEELAKAIEKWQSQNRKGFLELCILRCIQIHKRVYGYALMELLQNAGIELSEGSLYPLLSRLIKEKTLSASWETPQEGHPRKYYSLTPFGLAFLDAADASYANDLEAYTRLAIIGGQS